LAASAMLGFYAEQLNGVELNGSFYRTPPVTTLQKWADDVPLDFRFCMKANRGLTYSAEAFDKIGLARIFTERIATLGVRLGPVLLQFPPVRQKNVALLDSLLAALGRPAAVEFRHVSWFDDETYRVLREHRGALVVTDEEKWPRAPLVDVSSVAYFRLRRGYAGGASFRPWIAEVRSALAAHEEVHVYFRHEPESPALARRLLKSQAPARRLLEPPAPAR